MLAQLTFTKKNSKIDHETKQKRVIARTAKQDLNHILTLLAFYYICFFTYEGRQTFYYLDRLFVTIELTITQVCVTWSNLYENASQ